MPDLPSRRNMMLLSLLSLTGCRSDRLRTAESTADAAPGEAALRQVNYSVEGPNGPEGPAAFQTTPSGLRYRILRQGNGAHPRSTSEVKVSYRGWLADGTQFDSSYDRGQPTSFRLDQVIPGWTEGIQLVGEGGKIELIIPSDLGYGLRGAPPDIPPAATLHFVVELHRVL